MGDLGKLLRETREAKNISLEQVNIDLKIKPRYIEAIEENDLNIFPSTPMARGFVRNYAEYLGLDPEDTLTHNLNGDSELHKNGKIDTGITFMNLSMARRSPVFNIDGIITLLIIIALLGSATLFIYTQYMEPDEVGATSFPEPVEYQIFDDDSPAVVLPTPTIVPTDTPTPTSTPTPQYYTGVSVELNIHERSWVQILVDGNKEFEGNMEVGDRPNWTGEKSVGIRAGNGGGIEVFVNGQNMGFMGEPGQVIDQVWEKVEETAIPEATETPTL